MISYFWQIVTVTKFMETIQLQCGNSELSMNNCFMFTVWISNLGSVHRYQYQVKGFTRHTKR